MSKVNKKTLSERRERCKRANELIKAIASHGRKFFSYKKGLSHFEIADNGRVWFVDGYCGDRIYMHRRPCDYRWSGFNEGGTLKKLVKDLAEFVKTGKSFPAHHLGPWPEWYSAGDPWGYGGEMSKVQEAAIMLGFYPKEEAGVAQ